MGIMKRLLEKGSLSKEEKNFIKRSQEDRRHFPIKEKCDGNDKKK